MRGRHPGIRTLVVCAVGLTGCSTAVPVTAPATPAPGEMPVDATLPFRNPNLPLEVRVDDLLGRLTLKEKVAQTLYTAPAIDRLGIPEYNWWNEALHGVARAGIATVFPQAIGLAATWDPDLMLRVATAISDEARAKHHEAVRQGRRGIYEGLTFWSPNINIFRDPRWGRGMETFGEDPFLAGRLAVAFVRGMQGDDPFYLKTVATPKHYAVHSGPEPHRHTFDAVVSERDLRETYLPAFQAAVVHGKAESVMCAYNRFRGEPACASPFLLQDVLRDEWGFEGYVVSDCWAISDIYSTHRVVETAAEAAALAVRAGTDLNCGVSFERLAEAVQDGLLSQEELDRSVRRLIRTRIRLGVFDPPDLVPFADIPFEVNDSKEHQDLALAATREAMVLLKNEGDILPLSKEAGTIAVIGPNADDVEVLLGNYNGFPSAPVTPLQGIREKVLPSTDVIYTVGSGLAEGLPALAAIPSSALQTEGAGGVRSASGGAPVEGLKAEYFDNPTLEGEPVITRTDTAVDFQWWGVAPFPTLTPGKFSVRWTGSLRGPVAGSYGIGGKGLGDFRIFLEDSLVAESSSEHEIITRWAHAGLTEGEGVDIRVEYRPRREFGAIQLVWDPPGPNLSNAALRAAESADVVVMVMGLSPRLEGEELQVDVPGFGGGDRVDIGLPSVQRDLLQAVSATGKPVVLVLLNGSALAIPWAADNVPAILEAWYPGQAAGTAIADVLFGDYNPAGRLPVTFYRSVNDLPPFESYDMEGRTYRYFRGDPLFPFGHGLSFTRFSYRNFTFPDSVLVGQNVTVSADVRNEGRREGEEVVQLYLTDLDAPVPVPVRTLVGMERIFLEAGEERTVTFTIAPEAFTYINDSGGRVQAPGTFTVSIGGKQPGFSGLADSGSTQVVTGRVVLVGQAPGEMPGTGQR